MPDATLLTDARNAYVRVDTQLQQIRNCCPADLKFDDWAQFALDQLPAISRALDALEQAEGRLESHAAHRQAWLEEQQGKMACIKELYARLEQAQRDVERLRQSLESERQAHAAFVQQAAGSDCGCPYLESPGVLHFESCSQHDPERCPTCQVSHEHAALAQRGGEEG